MDPEVYNCLNSLLALLRQLEVVGLIDGRTMEEGQKLLDKYQPR